jgi:small subunit ribosomal protein S2
MSNITTQSLLDARVHFGHMSRKWNPKMSKFILMKKNDLHIIDLNKTINCLSSACSYLKDLALAGKKIMFVGTKQQAKTIISTEAAKISMPYVTERWLGGTLTNFLALRRLIKKWQSFEKLISSSTYKNLTKKEQLTMLREKNKLGVLLGGLGDVSRLPSALFVVDVKREHIAVREAISLGIPVVAMLDTNADPDLVDLPIPSNDDSVSSIDLIIRTITKSIEEGLQERLIIKQQEIATKESASKKDVDSIKAGVDESTSLATQDQKLVRNNISRVMTGAKTRPSNSGTIEKTMTSDAQPKPGFNTKKQSLERSSTPERKTIVANPKISATTPKAKVATPKITDKTESIESKKDK